MANLPQLRKGLLVLKVVIGLIVTYSCANEAKAQEAGDDGTEQRTVNEMWPEVNIHLSIYKNVRVILSGKRERDVAFKNMEYGSEVEFSVSRFRPFVFDQDDSLKQRLSIRSGYKYKRSFDTGHLITEHRPTLEATLRWLLREQLPASNRARLEFRLVNGVYSWRFRDQLRVERELNPKLRRISVFGAAEAFFQSGSDRWNRFRFSGGLMIPMGKHLALEPYYLRQVSTASNPHNINVLGLAVQLYVRR